jgi:hypothetical protein
VDSAPPFVRARGRRNRRRTVGGAVFKADPASGRIRQDRARGGDAIDTSRAQPEPSIAAALPQATTSDPQFWLVQFVGPTPDEWLKEIEALSFEVVIYMPSYA